MKLRLAESHPCQVHVRIEFFGLKPKFIFRIVRLFRVPFGFRFDGVQLDALTAFLDRLVHLRTGRFGSFVIRYGIEIQDRAVIICVRIANGLKTFFVSYIAVIENIIFDFRLMERPCRPCVFLSGTRGK